MQKQNKQKGHGNRFIFKLYGSFFHGHFLYCIGHPISVNPKKWGPWEVAKTHDETTTNAIENGAQRLSSEELTGEHRPCFHRLWCLHLSSHWMKPFKQRYLPRLLIFIGCLRVLFLKPIKFVLVILSSLEMEQQ